MGRKIAALFWAAIAVVYGALILVLGIGLLYSMFHIFIKTL